jgi:hypothetical protein
MKNTVSAKLLHALLKGKKQLSTEALSRISHFIESQRADDESFINKSGISDLYYTSFGWILSYMLGIKSDIQKMEFYLSKQEPETLDLIHYAAYMRCRMIVQLMKNGKTGFMLRSFFSTKVKLLDDFKSVPHNDMQSPYTQYIMLSLIEDAGQGIYDKKYVAASFADYHSTGGGYRNTKDGPAATTNATVAALAVKGQLTGYKENEDVLYLRKLQNASGGFSAAASSPVPDLLSTATALFMLNCYHIKPIYPAGDFIEAHWLDSGGFSATLLDDKSDVEYTFYGLLALGTV